MAVGLSKRALGGSVGDLVGVALAFAGAGYLHALQCGGDVAGVLWA